MCIDIVEICFGIANGQISSVIDSYLPAIHPYLTSVNLNGFSANLICAFIIVEVCFGIAHWQISLIFDRVICPQQDNGGVLSFHFFSSPELCSG